MPNNDMTSDDLDMNGTTLYTPWPNYCGNYYLWVYLITLLIFILCF